ncbi:MAG: ComEC/Rec2 family competence protein, partial [Pseudomonadota bacterium]|nr:ComEC/Rec2 family competence protein [Pseudomonadota bacterium]
MQRLAWRSTTVGDDGTFQALQHGATRNRKPVTLLQAGAFRPGRVRRALLRLSQLRLDLSGGLSRAVERERECGTLFNFVPVCLALGILTYFTLPSEPLAPVVACSSTIAAVLALRMQVRGAAHLSLVALALFLAGMCIAQWRTLATGAPVIAQTLTANIEGLVLQHDRNSRGSPRYLIRPTAISGLDSSELPARIRLSASSGERRFEPGDMVAGKARIMPVNGPAYPGGYDFGFFARFDRLGGTGFFLGAPGAGRAQAAPTLREHVSIALNALRTTLANRVRAGLPGEAGDIAVALIIGDRSGIDAETAESLRRSGLAHVLAISGLHMALVALTVVWGLRWLAAWSSTLTLNYPVAKWAAAAGLAAASAYLLLSGASVATQRAWVMIAVMLTAALADRRAVTIRNVAIAATLILVVSPESVMEPGFQMSFAAAVSLVAAYQALRKRSMQRERNRERVGAGMASAVTRRAFTYMGGIVFTSLVAGLATGLFAAWHFHRIAPLGLVANALAMPIVTTAVMPFALLSALAMPYGFELPFLQVLGLGIERMVMISDWINSFGIAGVTGVQSLAVLLTGSLGIVLLTQLHTRLRLSGILPIALLPLLVGPAHVPDIVAAQDGRAVAVADDSGRLVALYPRRNRFVTDIWLRAWSGGVPGERSGVVSPDCDRDRCAARLKTGHLLHVVYDPDLLTDSCEKADILLAPRLRWVNCRQRWPALILKRGDFETGGSHAV